MVVQYLKQTNREKNFLLVKDNLKCPPLALLQPRVSPRAKEQETVETAYTGQRKVRALEEMSVEGNTIQKSSENPKDKGSLHDGILWRKGPRQEKSLSGKANQPTRFAFKKG